jgi:hypothetical protein
MTYPFVAEYAFSLFMMIEYFLWVFGADDPPGSARNTAVARSYPNLLPKFL